jgi:hypothetical protein
MAIYSCNLKSIGRVTHKAGTAGAHVRYIARDRAEPEILSRHMPDDPNAARAFLDAGEREDRKNARVVDKIRVALPRELDEKQRAVLVQDFMKDLTGNKVPWFAAIHQTGKDAHNPHAHIVLRDRDLETGKRVVRLSDSVRDRTKAGLPGPKAINWVRERWEHHLNRSLERAGHESRVDHRTLEAQGIDKAPQIHVGPNAQQIDKFVERPESVVRSKGKRSNWKGDGWTTDYPMIDAGRTRRERNQEIIDLNLERDLRSKDFNTRAWAQFEKQQGLLDRNLENQIIPEARKRTLEERRVRQEYKERLDRERKTRDHDLKMRRDWTRQKYAPTLSRIQNQQKEKVLELETKQGKLFNRLWSGLSSNFRHKQEQTKAELLNAQRSERMAFREKYRDEVENKGKTAQERSKSKIEVIRTERQTSLHELRDRHKVAEQKTDTLLQARENEREQERQVLEKTIAEWKQFEKQYDKEPKRTQGRGRERTRSRDRGYDYER